MNYPAHAARTVALHSQGLATQPALDGTPDADTIYAAIERMGCVQIDTLSVVRRSQYLALWSRLGSYDATDLDSLAFGGERRLFEYWSHEACLIPLEEFRYHLPMMNRHREGTNRRGREMSNQADEAEQREAVRERIRSEGPLRSADFEDERGNSKGWWDWKPAKRALENLYDRGELMVAERVNFHRIYDLSERVLPAWVNATEPTYEETCRYFLERAVRALGICLPGQAADYVRIKRNDAKPYLAQLEDEGVLVRVQVEGEDGKTHAMIVHRDNVASLEQAMDGALTAERTTFLSPFDSLFWATGRDVQLWGFRQKLESYTPEPKRQWGYFCLPILHKGKLVGRFDPKLDRKTGTLYLKALYLESDVSPDEELVNAVAGAMRDFMAFHSARDLVIERSEPANFGKRLAKAVGA